MRPDGIVFPKSVCVRVTRRCNALCSFCQAPHTSRTELSIESLVTISKALHKKGVQSLKLSGGEPTVRPDLPELIEATGNVLTKIVVVSNGIKLHPDVAVAATSVGAEFKFSIHRPDTSNDKVLGVPSFNKVLHSLEICRRQDIKFSIHTVVTTDNIGLMRSMVEFALEHGARKISFIPVVPRGRAASGNRDTITSDGLTLVHATVADLAEEYGERITVKCIDFWDHDYWVIENDGILWIERSREGLDERICDLPELLAM